MADDARRYRKIQTRMYGDDKFLELTPVKPSGQSLWIYLLTGPHTTVIPGLFEAGERELAEKLKWPLVAFRRHWTEISDRSMAHADWRRRVVWVPKAKDCNAPESPNVVRAWAAALEEIPDCDLKRSAAISLADFVSRLGDGFRKALLEAWPKAYTKASSEAFPKASPNQEQEQEQDLFSVDELAATWNQTAQQHGFRLCHELNTDRRRAAAARLREKPAREYWLGVIARLTASDFCHGHNDRGWVPDFDFLTRKATHIKALEGKYDNRVCRPVLREKPEWRVECEQIHGGACSSEDIHAIKTRGAA